MTDETLQALEKLAKELSKDPELIKAWKALGDALGVDVTAEEFQKAVDEAFKETTEYAKKEL